MISSQYIKSFTDRRVPITQENFSLITLSSFSEKPIPAPYKYGSYTKCENDYNKLVDK